MTPHTFVAAVLAELAVLLAPLATTVLTSAFSALPAAGTTLLVGGDQAAIGPERQIAPLALPISALVPVDEAASPFDAEQEARQDDAEQLLFGALDLIQSGQNTAWHTASRQGQIQRALARPDLKGLFAVARCEVRLMVRHDTPYA